MPEIYIVKRQEKMFRCLRCKAIWRPQNVNLYPTKCPKCFNPYWQREVGSHTAVVSDFVVEQEVSNWVCQLCDNEWRARDLSKPPRKCPNCQNPNWKVKVKVWEAE